MRASRWIVPAASSKSSSYGRVGSAFDGILNGLLALVGQHTYRLAGTHQLVKDGGSRPPPPRFWHCTEGSRGRMHEQ